jgi:hypothetical protein
VKKESAIRGDGGACDVLDVVHTLLVELPRLFEGVGVCAREVRKLRVRTKPKQRVRGLVLQLPKAAERFVVGGQLLVEKLTLASADPCAEDLEAFGATDNTSWHWSWHRRWH